MLGKLEKVDVREIWKHEALNFTNWLAKDDNIALLSEVVGLDIEIIGTEAKIGSFSLDILAKDSSTDKKIVIENQLERTDHDHLGKIITYASGHEAETIIWIVKDVRDEHRKAVEWLNNHLDESINIFLIRIEVWRIGNSKAAPKFDLVESPNNWAKTIKKSGSGNKVLSRIEGLQLEFWTTLKEFGEDNYKNIRFQTPKPMSYLDFNVTGSRDYHIVASANSQRKVVGVGIYIKRDKTIFHQFKDQKDIIEKELGMELEWKELPGKKASKIIAYEDFDIDNKDDWFRAHDWILNKIEVMTKTFNKYE